MLDIITESLSLLVSEDESIISRVKQLFEEFKGADSCRLETHDSLSSVMTQFESRSCQLVIIDMGTINIEEVKKLSSQYNAVFLFLLGDSDQLSEMIHQANNDKASVLGIYERSAMDSILFQLEFHRALDLAASLYTVCEEHHLMKTLINTMPDLIFIKDKDSRFILTNDAHAKLLGMESPDDFIGKTDHDLHPKEMADKYRDDEMDVLQSKKALVTYEEQVFDGDGNKGWLLSTKAPIYDRQGRMGVVGINRDITRRKEAEELGLKYAQELEKRNQDLENDLKLARQIQTALLSQKFPTFPFEADAESSRLKFKSYFHPGEAVSGDFHHIQALSDHCAAIFICDVMGNNIRSALLSSLLQGLIKRSDLDVYNPSDYMAELNRSIIDALSRQEHPIFTSALYMLIDLNARRLWFANAGHPLPINVHLETGQAEFLQNSNGIHYPVLGLFENIEYPAMEAMFQPNDILLLYTNGLYESGDPTSKTFGMEHLLDHVSLAARNKEQFFESLIKLYRDKQNSEAFCEDVCLVGAEFRS